ncbi:hypothetical protein [Roseiflexus sp.]|uniref:hypothetical protein n=1 Tax=Roseiflexus sp. TaxID=2562120 RepID=UPI00398B25B1
MLDSVILGEFEVLLGRISGRTISILLPPGDHVLTLEAPATPDPARAGAPISVRLFTLDVHSDAWRDESCASEECKR